MKAFLCFLKKELLLEWRGLESFTVLLAVELMLSVVCASSFSASGLSPGVAERLFPTFLWITVLFSSILASTRASSSEFERKAYQRLLIVKAPFSQLYLAKVLVSSIVSLVGYILALVFISELTAVSATVVLQIPRLLLVGFLGVIGLSSLTVLLSVIAQGSKVGGVLLPLLVLPLSLPIFWGVSELSQVVNLSRVSPSWWSVLIFTDLLYLLVGLNLYESVFKE